MLRLLSIIASQAPFKPNLSKLAQKTNIHRNTLNNYFQFLTQANLIQLIYPKNHSISALQKPDKIFLNNTNLLYVLADQPPNISTVREHFAASQLSVNHQIRQPKECDFLVKELLKLLTSIIKTTKLKPLNNCIVKSLSMPKSHRPFGSKGLEPYFKRSKATACPPKCNGGGKNLPNRSDLKGVPKL